MKIMKKTSLFYTLLLLATTFNTHKTHTMKRIRENENQPAQSFNFTGLLPELRNQVVLLLGAGSTARSVEEAGKAINAFAQTNKELNQAINNPQICLAIIKNLSQRFKCTDTEAAEALQTEEAKRRLDIQKQFLDVCKTEEFELDEKELNFLYEQYKGYVDLNFTYHYLDDEDDNFYNMTLLMIAIRNNDCEVIKKLIELGADIHKTNFYGDTTLIFALGYATMIAKTIQCLLQYPIEINHQNKEGDTALIVAAKMVYDRDNYDKNNTCIIIRDLLNRGANINIANNNGLTALMWATKFKNQNTVKCLLEYPKIAINQQDKKGQTALIWAVRNNDKLTIKLLLDAGADPEIATYDGHTPLHSTNDQETFDLIQEAINKKHEKQGKFHGFYKK